MRDLDKLMDYMPEKKRQAADCGHYFEQQLNSGPTRFRFAIYYSDHRSAYRPAGHCNDGL
jgi:hypothetical protein